MADPLRYIEGLNETTDPASGDWLWIVDVSAGASDKDRKVSGGLVPWTNKANTFTAVQEINLSTNGPLLVLDTAAAATSAALTIQDNNTDRASVWTESAGQRWLALTSANDLGARAGIGLLLANNNNASTPAGGFIRFGNAANSWRAVWVDATGNLRIHTAYPTNANDTAGTVVGAQTSSLDAKDITGPPPAPAEALRYIAEAADAVRGFRYKDGSFGNEEFSGLVVDYAPRYGMDRDAEHPHGKSLNVITAIGDLMIAVDYLAGRVAALEAYNAR